MSLNYSGVRGSWIWTKIWLEILHILTRCFPLNKKQHVWIAFALIHSIQEGKNAVKKWLCGLELFWLQWTDSFLVYLVRSWKCSELQCWRAEAFLCSRTQSRASGAALQLQTIAFRPWCNFLHWTQHETLFGEKEKDPFSSAIRAIRMNCYCCKVGAPEWDNLYLGFP